MLTGAIQPLAQIIGRLRRAKQIPVTVEHARLDFQNRVRFLEGGADVLGFPALERIISVTFCLHVSGEGITLGLVHHGLSLFLAVHVQESLSPGIGETLECFGHSVLRFLKLEVSQSVGNGLGAGLGFLPAGAVIADVVSCRRVAQFLTEVLAEQAGLADIRTVLRIIGKAAGTLSIPLLGRHIAFFPGNPLEEALGRAPDRLEFGVIQRRITPGCTIHECLVSLIGITKAFEHTTGKTGHRAVAAAFRDGFGVRIIQIPEVIAFRIRVVHFQAFVQCDRAGMQFNKGIRCAEEEMCCVFCPGIEIRERLVRQLGQTLVFLVVCDLVCQQNAVELGPRSLAALGFHMVTAVVDGQRHIRKSAAHILGSYPIRRIIGVIVVAVLAQAVR